MVQSVTVRSIADPLSAQLIVDTLQKVTALRSVERVLILGRHACRPSGPPARSRPQLGTLDNIDGTRAFAAV